MRVLLVNDYAPGAGWGAEAHLARLIEGLTAAGDTVETFAAESARRGLGKAFDVWNPPARRALAKRAAAFRPDVVHHHNLLRELSVSVLGVPRGAPTVLTVHELRLFGIQDDAYGLLRGLGHSLKARVDLSVARAKADVAIAVSVEVARRLREAGFRRVELVPNFSPFHLPPEARPVAESFDVVFAGRLEPAKGAAVLADAFARIADRHPSARLVVAGDGPERATVEALGVPGRLIMTGRIPEHEVAALMALARVVVAPSIPRLHPEGAGLTVIEAALLGRPVIVSDDPALRELVDEASCGLVVPPEDAAALAAALDAVLSDPGRGQAMGDAGRRVARATRTPEVVVARIREIYATAIRSFHPSRDNPNGPDSGIPAQ